MVERVKEEQKRKEGYRSTGVQEQQKAGRVGLDWGLVAR